MCKLHIFIVWIIILTSAVSTFAKSNDNVTLIVSSNGPTINEATQHALESAIKQTFSVFVSSDTHLLNDKRTISQFISSSSGIIKVSKEVSSSVYNGTHAVTLEVVVNIDQLAAYAKSKGESGAYNGNESVSNILKKRLYTENESYAVESVVNQFLSQLQNGCDYSIKIEPVDGSVSGHNQNMPIDFSIDVKFNKYGVSLWNNFMKDLRAIESNTNKNLLKLRKKEKNNLDFKHSVCLIKKNKGWEEDEKGIFKFNSIKSVQEIERMLSQFITTISNVVITADKKEILTISHDRYRRYNNNSEINIVEPIGGVYSFLPVKTNNHLTINGMFELSIDEVRKIKSFNVAINNLLNTSSSTNSNHEIDTNTLHSSYNSEEDDLENMDTISDSNSSYYGHKTSNNYTGTEDNIKINSTKNYDGNLVSEYSIQNSHSSDTESNNIEDISTDDYTTLIISAEGTDMEDAIENALQLAIEQIIGLQHNTNIEYNPQSIKDLIRNIEVVEGTQLTHNNYNVKLKVVASIP